MLCDLISGNLSLAEAFGASKS